MNSRALEVLCGSHPVCNAVSGRHHLFTPYHNWFSIKISEMPFILSLSQPFYQSLWLVNSPTDQLTCHSGLTADGEWYRN